MADSILLTFLKPEFSASVHGVLQTSFALVFVAALFVTPWLVWRAARNEQWQRRLDVIDREAGPAAAYGSPEELSGAVATPAERWADVLPSLLLVFGLLGTFIGLGLALTEAASVLNNSQHAAGANPLDNLTPIMNSLGSKFKTSTWGIMAFLTLKLWFMRNPYEERRLLWAAQKVQAHAAHAAEQAAQREAAERQRLIDTIAQSNDALLAGQRQAVEHAGLRHAALLELQQQLATRHLDALTGASAAQLAVQERAIGAITQAGAAQLAAQERAIDAITQAGAAQLAAQERANDAIAQAGASQLAAQERAIDAITRAGASQVTAQERSAEAVLAQLQRGATAAELQAERAELQLRRLDALQEHTEATRDAMHNFVDSVQHNIGTMASAADNMSTAAAAAGQASVDLGEVIQDFRTTMISVLDSIKSDLGASINTMQTDFGTNMTAMSASLAQATSGIENAITHLSSGVSNTIETLKQASQQSVDLQLKAQATFAASGEELMASLGEVQNYVQQMQTRTESGLRSVSDAGQKMAHAIATFAALQDAVIESNVRSKELVEQNRSTSEHLGQLIVGIAQRQESDQQLVTLLQQATLAIGQPARLADESVQRLTSALNQPAHMADESIQRLASALTKPARVADESIDRLATALTRPAHVADESIERLAAAVGRQVRAADATPV
ncbi:hypothetical protein FHW58_001119 [Duganella sp. 1224]|uniref:hypothetical protein n=1 Tax=Duganella sp. 1224 TaxID=2587052 RepID=UPI0015CD0466|nr:hypothetical protein [Duganella sp. 1224]NYE59967.1 hypothetical protein [Duganella sp. 1224]